MEIEFVCPRTTEALTESACEKNYEYEACRGCTSQQDAARKALYDVLKQKYGNRMPVSLEKDEVRLVVRDDLTLLADPGDWRESACVGVDCGRYGYAHSHPLDVRQWVENFLAGNIVILLSEHKLSSAMLYTTTAAYWDGWQDWSWAVDVSGTYPAEEYAKVKGFIRHNIRHNIE